MVVYKPIMDIDGVDVAVNSFEKNMVAPLEGEIIKVDKIGRKRLAYDIRKFRDGFMMVTYFKMPPGNLVEFNRLMHIQEDVISNHRDSLVEEERNYASSSNVMRERLSG